MPHENCRLATGQVWRRRWYADLVYIGGPFMPKYLRVVGLNYSPYDERLVGVDCVDADESYSRRTYEMPVRRGRITGFRLVADGRDWEDEDE